MGVRRRAGVGAIGVVAVHNQERLGREREHAVVIERSRSCGTIHEPAERLEQRQHPVGQTDTAARRQRHVHVMAVTQTRRGGACATRCMRSQQIVSGHNGAYERLEVIAARAHGRI